jgi:hypothetical protein
LNGSRSGNRYYSRFPLGKRCRSFDRRPFSDEFPDHGLFAYHYGDIWADLRKEELLTHNQVKAACTVTLGGLLQQTRNGRFVADRMRWSNIAADLSTEPDETFNTWVTLQS